MNNDQVTIALLSFLASTLRLSTPLFLSSFAGLVSERSGVIQIALEGMMLLGALVAAITAHYTHSAWLGLFVSAFAVTLFALLKGFFVLKLKADQIITGISFNIFVIGFAPYLTKILFDSTGQTPSLPPDSRFTFEPILFSILICALIIYLYHKTKVGLWLQFCGELPEALLVSGIRPLKVRWFALGLCGFLAGASGASLSLYLSSSYSPLMSAGRGFMALAALIFGRWKPVPTFFACLMFGALDALQIQLQTMQTTIPLQFIQALPYIFTIIAVSGFLGKSKAPQALGQAQ